MDRRSQEFFAAVHPTATLTRRRIAGLLVLTILLLVTAVAGLALGARTLSPDVVVQALTCPDGWPLSCPASTPADQIVRELRLPRTGLALLTGLALGLGGALIQGYTRNPLADSGLLGLNAGAAFLAALAMQLFGLTRPDQYIWFAFAGALIAGLVVFAASSAGGGAASPLGLVLAGAAVTALLQALTNAVVLLHPTTLDTYRYWVVGTVAGHDAGVLVQVLPFLIVGILLAVAAAPGLNALALGEDVARGLGVRVGGNRALGLAAIVLLTGGATAAVGPISFLGLIVPHAARMVTGPDHRWLLPYAALLGALLLGVADIVGRLVARPGELQTGIVLAAVGAPCFLWFVRRRQAVAA